MAAQATHVDSLVVADLAVLGELNSATALLLERGVLPRGRAYAAATKASGARVLVSTRPSGTRSTETSHFIDAQSALPAFPAALKDVATTLHAILTNRATYRSALFVPALGLSAFAVAGLPLPIVYGSGLLRRTPHPIPLLHRADELDPAEILRLIDAHPGNSAVLLAHRGVIAYGDEPLSKLARFVVSLEESAQLTLNAQLLGGAQPLPADAYEQMQQGIAGD